MFGEKQEHVAKRSKSNSKVLIIKDMHLKQKLVISYRSLFGILVLSYKNYITVILQKFCKINKQNWQKITYFAIFNKINDLITKILLPLAQKALYNQIFQNLVTIFKAKLTIFLISNNVFCKITEFLISMQVLTNYPWLTHSLSGIKESC